MADRTFTQYRYSDGDSSNPESILTNYVSNFKDYFSMRISRYESVMIVGDYNGGTYSNCTVYIYNSDNRQITKSEYDNVYCTVYQNYYTRGNCEGIPSVPTYTSEYNLSVIFFGFVALSLFCVTFLVRHFWKLVRRASR